MARRQNGEPDQFGGSNYEKIPIAQLHFDSENPRLQEHGVKLNATQADIQKSLWEQMAVEELAMSIAHNGYFPHEPLFIEDRANGPWTVIEGNRRLAAVKLLLDADLRQRLKATDLPDIDAIDPTRRGALADLPVIRTTREKAWRYLGFKHVNGPSPWGAYAKAQYIATVRNNYHVPLDEIASQIGDYTNVVERLYHGLMVVEQAERNDLFSRTNIKRRKFEFSHIYEGLRREGIKKYLGLTKDARATKDPVPAAKLKNLSHILQWIYGNKEKNIDPIMRTQAKDLNLLSAVLLDPKGSKALRDGLTLQMAHDLSVGDIHLFTKALNATKKNLQDAHGLLTTGYEPNADDTELRTAVAIEQLATDLVDAMRLKQRRHRRVNQPEGGDA